MAIGNRYEFMFYIQCINGNPNGDPDMGNTPRMDPEDMCGYITDVAIKRRIRNYIQTAYEGQDGMSIIMQNATNINKFIAKAKENAGVDYAAKDKNSIYAARKEACSMFYDVRTFGAVLSTGPNAGQVRGPVQLTFAKSIDPILPLDISITRMVVADGDKDKDSEYYANLEANAPEDKLRTMGRKQFLPYGLYEARGFISANLAAETGFDDNDLKALFEAILNMYEHDRSASKGEMSVISPIIIFKHVGTDSNNEQRAKQAKLGCAPAHKLFELININKKADIELPRSYRDYECSIKLSAVPSGVEVGFLENPYDEITWGKVPDQNDWLTTK
ncbi:type I-C CRISPR-associated protein Cas7/Csd2 [Ruminococcus flavefaciens]|uniref:type I-C CRISPR-associated protein Cas7/Csd2 n=1 Tax=Ruminococcus flavefaciens TaxID=1265 RepID=UPI00156392FB|nr:type I-C CRISPR-associated protein Cas7/Csd2 [Ruminococcus flavefaciens]